MPQTKFKVGDQVKFLDNNDYEYSSKGLGKVEKDDTGTIVEIKKTWCWIEWDRHSDKDYISDLPMSTLQKLTKLEKALK